MKMFSHVLKATDWCRANYEYFRGGGFSSHFKTEAELPVTLIRVNLIKGIGPTLQIAEGYTCVLDEEIHKVLDERTDKTWPTTWFAPNLGEDGFETVYDCNESLGSKSWCICSWSYRSRFNYSSKYAKNSSYTSQRTT